jgi:hypothetical protein
MVAYWVQNRRDTAANWISYNPTLRPGEIGHETDTNRSKMGDGISAWRSLPYWSPSGALPPVSSGTLVLAAGTATVANSSITASSIVRLSRQAAGGTLGQLSVALTPGSGFTVNSSSVSETSHVYYEVVSY